MASPEGTTLFFFGTLMVPAVLARVIGREDSKLAAVDAVLPDYTRHHVSQADYPAIVPARLGASIMGRELSEDEASVRGSLVHNLTAEDIAFLDEFEGDEYSRDPVKVTLLSSGDQVDAFAYTWIAPLSRLEPALWSFADFMRDKAHRWVGTGASDAEYLEVDRRRAMAGVITPPSENVLPTFGKAFGEKYWSFEKGWINVNHGSYGAAPKSVIEAFRAVQDRSAGAPDRFIRLEYMSELAALRARLASQIVNCDTDDLVLVGNTTFGVNTVLRSLGPIMERGDKFLYLSSTIYDACEATLQYVVDSQPHLALQLVPIPVQYPISHADLLQVVEKAIIAEEAKGGKIRLALFDAISSLPGVAVPWVEIVKILKAHNIISLIDAAHEVGQQAVDLRAAQPDFWISNCHKWLMAHRGCAILYVSKPYQYLMHSFPIGHYYRNRKPDSPAGGWVYEFEWNGTIDYSPWLSTSAALDFRQSCGGEARITSYCHKLAVEAGALVAKELGTEVLGEEEHIACMVNVRLPIAYNSDEVSAVKTYLVATQIMQHGCIGSPFAHNGKWYVRFSAQIYNELEDYAYVANVLKDLCCRVEKGEHLSKE